MQEVHTFFGITNSCWVTMKYPQCLVPLLCLWATLGPFCATAQVLWTCNDNLITLAKNTLFIHRSDYESGDITLDAIEVGPIGDNTNAIGYRKSDNAIYGICRVGSTDRSLFRLSNTGEVSYLLTEDWVKENNLGSVAACMMPDDRHFLLYRGDHLSWIDLEAPSAPPRIVPIDPELMDAEIVDIAIDPVTELLYGFDYGFNFENASFVIIDPQDGRLVDRISIPNLSGGDGFPAIAINSDRMLIGFDPNVGDASILLYYHIPSGTFLNRIDQQVPLGEFDSGGVDGCSCSNSVSLERYYSRDTTFQCATLLLTLRSLNFNAQTAPGSYLLTDSLPIGFSYEEVVYNGGNYIIEGLGTRQLRVPAYANTFGLDSIVLRVGVEEQAPLGESSSSGALFLLNPVSGNYEELLTYSDNPTTITANQDPTSIYVQARTGAPSIVTEFFKCPDSTVLVDFLPELTSFQVEWFDGRRGDDRRFAEAGVYEVRIFDRCENYDLEVAIINSTTAIQLDSVYTLPYGVVFPLEAMISNNIRISQQQWFYRDELLERCSERCGPIDIPTLQNATISTSIIDEIGCRDSTSARLEITAAVYTGNAFSPNFDGQNDRFFLQSASPFPVAEFEIYDRWGNLFFQQIGGTTNDPTLGWDGDTRGRPAPPGAYIWRATLLLDGLPRSYEGQVQLTR